MLDDELEGDQAEDDAPLTVDDTVDVLARAQAEGEAEQLVGIERCARCGCTEITPCSEGCGWAAPNLCTGCAGGLAAFHIPHAENHAQQFIEHDDRLFPASTEDDDSGEI